MSSASSLHTGSHVTPIYLNLYDLGGCSNACVHTIGLSFYHCAVQTHSAEYGYMGHPYRFTGLYKTSKHDSRFHLYRLRDSIEVGWTWSSEKDIDQIVHDLNGFYIGCDYHTLTKNSIHFAKYLLEQLSNDLQLKHLEPIKILQLPSYIDRGRRLTSTFEFLQMFDTEKDIAEINILYFLYMKYEGDMKEISHILKCDTLNKLRRCITLIEQGIQQRNLPIFVAFTTFEMKTAYEYLYILGQNTSDASPSPEQLTLTDVFRQFDTITLRGRTSIDRYLNIQRTKQSQWKNQLPTVDRTSIPFDYQQRSSLSRARENLPNPKTSIKPDSEHIALPSIQRSSLAQAKSQNQDRTPLPSRSVSNVSEFIASPADYSHVDIPSSPIFVDPSLQLEHLHMRTAVPIGTILRLQDTTNPDLPLTKLHLSTVDDPNSLSLLPNRQRKYSYTSRKRKLPRDLEVSNDLYTITTPSPLRYNYTNNARSTLSHSSHETLFLPKVQIGDDLDSSV